jgi:hypothetical protein
LEGIKAAHCEGFEMIDELSEDDLEAAILQTYARQPKLKERAKPEKRRAAEQAATHKFGTRGGKGRPTGRTKQFNQKLRPDLDERVRAAVAMAGLTLADFMELAFTEYLNRNEKDWQAKAAAREARRA